MVCAGLQGLYAHTYACYQKTDIRVIDFLNKIANASDSLSYEATTVITYFISPDSLNQYKLKSVITPKKSRWQFIGPPSRAMAIYILNGDSAFTKNTKSDTAWVRFQPKKDKYTDPNNFYIDPTNRVLLLTNYTVTFIGEENLFNRTAEVVKITPVHKDRGWVQLWVDKKTGLFYRYEWYNRENKLCYQENKEQVFFNPKIEPSLFDFKASHIIKLPPLPEPNCYNNISDAGRNVNFSVMVPNFLPPGYNLNNIQIDKLKARDGSIQQVVQLDYTDGLSSFSLFMHRASKGDIAKYKTPKVSERYDYGKFLMYVIGVKNTTYLSLVGNLPKDTLLKMFNNIEEFRKSKQ